MLKTLIVKAALIAFVGSVSFAAHAIADTQRFDVPAGDLVAALESFAKQADVDLVYQDEQVKGLRTGGVSGEFSPRDAVMKLLEGTPLQLRTDEASGALLITTPLPSGVRASSTSAMDEKQPKPTAGADSAAVRAKRSFWNRFRLAQAETNPAAQGERSERDDSPPVSAEAEKNRIVLEELVVTGTRIRDAEGQFSPVQSFDRDQLDAAGQYSVYDFASRLPQNFGGGVSPQNAGAGGTAGPGAMAINLRGLGAGSTLSLVNGRRLAGGGLIGAIADVSAIPLSAIERIDVAADGASAIYGADAIAGVVNFVLRRDFEGAETRVRAGTVSDGVSSNNEVAHTLGSVGDSYFAMASAQYSHSDRIPLREIEASLPATDNSDLSPSSSQWSAFGSGGIEIGTRLTITGDVLLSQRDSFHRYIAFDGAVAFDDAEVRQAAGGLTFEYELASDWSLSVSPGYAAARYRNARNRALSAGLATDRDRSDNETASVDLMLQGGLFDTDAGAIRAVIGTQYREESLDNGQNIDSGAIVASLKVDRQVAAIFGEVLVPLFSEANRQPFLEELSLSLAARYEDYSDFGETTNPRLGISYSPARGLTFRGTYGTSFRAPDLPLNFERIEAAILIDFADPNAPAGVRPVLWLQGLRGDLQPEEAETTTVGFDYEPSYLPGFGLRLTAYDIDFRNRIGFPTILPDPSFLFLASSSRPLREGVSQAELQAIIARAEAFFNFPTFFGLPPIDLNDVDAVLDGRPANATSTKMRGVDLLFDYRTDIGDAQSQWYVNTSYIDQLDERISDSSPATQQFNVIFRPVDLRVRAGASFTIGDFDLGGSINYVGSYADNRGATIKEIPSWTTVDLFANYSLPGGTRVSLTAVNVFDEDAPRIASAATPGPSGRRLFYDPTNADARGRQIALQVTKRW